LKFVLTLMARVYVFFRSSFVAVTCFFVLLLGSCALSASQIDDDPLFLVLDECARDYVNFRVKSQGVLLKAEHYVHQVKGLRKTFYGGDVTKEMNWASFYLDVIQQLEYESDFMSFLSEETNKRLELGLYASIQEHDEKNILGVFVTQLVKDQFTTGRRPGSKRHQKGSGRIDQMDEYVRTYMSARLGGHQIIQRARSLIDNLTPQRRKKCKRAMYYIYLLDGMEEKGPGFLHAEYGRVEKLAAVPYQHTQATKRQNSKLKILRMFNGLLQRRNDEVRTYKKMVQNIRAYPAKMYIYLAIAFCSGCGFLYASFCSSDANTHSKLKLDVKGGSPSRCRKPSSPSRKKRQNRKKNAKPD